jgi:hypothetical protein
MVRVLLYARDYRMGAGERGKESDSLDFLVAGQADRVSQIEILVVVERWCT